LSETHEPASNPPVPLPPAAGAARVAPSSPTIADGRERQLDPRAVAAARLAGGIASAIIAGATLLALVTSLLTTIPGPLGALGMAVGWLLLNGALAVRTLLWPPVRHRHVSYSVDARGIRIRRGVVWRSEITVPRSRVQHTDVSRGPVERGFGLATLIIHTAGTEHAAVSLGGLAVESANEIRNFLIEGGEDDAV
jgi:membrane protein YdbS with pleckstrin-like domain